MRARRRTNSCTSSKSEVIQIYELNNKSQMLEHPGGGSGAGAGGPGCGTGLCGWGGGTGVWCVCV